MKPARSLFVIFILLLSGCGFIDFAYNNAPGFVADQIDDALELDQTQYAELEKGLQDFFSWHREQELAAYHQLLDDAALAAVDGVSAEEFMFMTGAIRGAYQRAMEKLIDSLGDLAPTLTPRQIEAFDVYYRETSERHVDYLEMTAQQREIHRVERSLDRLQNWFGNFDEYLEYRVSQRLQRLPDVYEPWLEFRQQRHQALMQALHGAAENGLSRDQLKSLVLDPDTEYAREFEPLRSAYWQAYAHAIEDISAWLNRAQKQRAASRLEGYARSVERLSQSS